MPYFRCLYAMPLRQHAHLTRAVADVRAFALAPLLFRHIDFAAATPPFRYALILLMPLMRCCHIISFADFRYCHYFRHILPCCFRHYEIIIISMPFAAAAVTPTAAGHFDCRRFSAFFRLAPPSYYFLFYSSSICFRFRFRLASHAAAVFSFFSAAFAIDAISASFAAMPAFH